MALARLITLNVKRLGRNRSHASPRGDGARRIVAMVDAGLGYDAIRRELGVSNADIDGALRQHAENDGSFLLHP